MPKEIFEKNEGEESYIPTPEESEFILNVYRDFYKDDEIKKDSHEVLGNRTLQDFWDRCNWDYGVLVDDSDPNDPVKPYASTISRDKSNTFITNLTLQLVYPGVTAQNNQQEIDHVVSSISKPLLEYSYDNDGAPSETGHQKTVRSIHRMVVEGTTHVQDDWVEDKLFSQLVPNEEIYIPNFWQPNIQLQPHVLRVQNDILFQQAEDEFGQLPNWKFVKPGNLNSLNIDDSIFKDELDGIVNEDRVQIIRAWYDVPKRMFKKLGVPRGAKRAKLFNVIINGVPMFKIDNLMPYEHGQYPITKGIFEHFSKSEFYWGNSMPNKARMDKAWLDGWKTLIRHKAKLSAIPPLLTFNGASLLDEDVYVPGKNTAAPSGMNPDDVTPVPGMNLDGVTSGDIAIMNVAREEIDSGNLSPQASGGDTPGTQTAREAVIREQNEQIILGGFGLQVAFFLQARAFPILKLNFQFLSRQRFKKIVVPDQELGNGRKGDLEIIFEKPTKRTDEERIAESRDILRAEIRAEEDGRPKRIVKINKEYIRNLDLYVKAVADPQPRKTTAMRRAIAQEKFNIYSGRPDLFNTRNAARTLVREMGDDENEMMARETPQGITESPEETELAGAPQTAGTPTQTQVNRQLGQLGADLGEI